MEVELDPGVDSRCMSTHQYERPLPPEQPVLAGVVLALAVVMGALFGQLAFFGTGIAGTLCLVVLLAWRGDL